MKKGDSGQASGLGGVGAQAAGTEHDKSARSAHQKDSLLALSKREEAIGFQENKEEGHDDQDKLDGKSDDLVHSVSRLDQSSITPM